MSPNALKKVEEHGPIYGPHYAACDAVSDALAALDISLSRDWSDAQTCVASLIRSGKLPDWFDTINWYDKRVVEHAARTIGVWPWPERPASCCPACRGEVPAEPWWKKYERTEANQ